MARRFVQADIEVYQLRSRTAGGSSERQETCVLGCFIEGDDTLHPSAACFWKSDGLTKARSGGIKPPLLPEKEQTLERAKTPEKAESEKSKRVNLLSAIAYDVRRIHLVALC